MESIKFNDKGHVVEFSKRSLKIDGKEYSYTGISQIKHSSAYHAYLFRYQGEWVKLFYEEPHGQTIAALFKKINAMNARRAAKARATQSIDTAAIAAALAGETEQKVEAAKAEAEAAAEKIEASVAEIVKPKAEAPVSEGAAEAETVEVPAVETAAVEAAPAAKIEEAVAAVAAAEVELPPAVEPVLEIPEAEAPAEAVEEPAAETTVEAEGEKPAETAEAAEGESPAEEKAEEILAEAEEVTAKKAKRKKAFIIFAIILALFIIAGIIYFLTMGTTNDASQAPNVDETHQYNDIDELIEEMQE